MGNTTRGGKLTVTLLKPLETRATSNAGDRKVILPVFFLNYVTSLWKKNCV